jgi:aspartyl-tRNA synthetase
MRRYGSDKPDLRVELEIADLTDVAGATDAPWLRQAVAEGGVVRALCVPGRGTISRREVDELTTIAVGAGARGLTTLAFESGGVKGALVRHLGAGALEMIAGRTGAREGDLVLLVAGPEESTAPAMGRLRLEVADRYRLRAGQGALRFLWVVEFPLLEYRPGEGRYVAVHHPFTAPLDEDRPLLETSPERVRAKAHDLVLNGLELGGGSIRIHERPLQEQIFRLLGITPEQAQVRFGFLLEALQYGAPPHGGIALGLDRFVMVLAGEPTIREVIAFPKTANATDLLVGAPAEVDPEVLREVHIRVAGE